MCIQWALFPSKSCSLNASGSVGKRIKVELVTRVLRSWNHLKIQNQFKPFLWRTLNTLESVVVLLYFVFYHYIFHAHLSPAESRACSGSLPPAKPCLFAQFDFISCGQRKWVTGHRSASPICQSWPSGGGEGCQLAPVSHPWNIVLKMSALVH